MAKSLVTMTNEALRVLAEEAGIEWTSRKEVLKALAAPKPEPKPEPQVEMVEMPEDGLHACCRCKVLTPVSDPICMQCYEIVTSDSSSIIDSSLVEAPEETEQVIMIHPYKTISEGLEAVAAIPLPAHYEEDTAAPAAPPAPTVATQPKTTKKRVSKKRGKGPAVRYTKEECEAIWLAIQAGSSAKAEAAARGVHVHTLITNMCLQNLPYKV